MNKKKHENSLLIFIFLLLFFGIIMLSLPFTIFSKTEYNNNAYVWKEHPDGSRIPNLKKGDRIEVSYTSDHPIKLYVVKASEAEDYNLHHAVYNFWGIDVLGPPLSIGTSGKIIFYTNSSGDWTIFFKNDSAYERIHISYSVKCPNHSSKEIFLPLGIFCASVSTYLIMGFIPKRGYKRTRFNFKR